MDEKKTKAMSDEHEAEFLSTARKLFDQAVSAEDENRKRAVDDLLFLDGEGQWPDSVKREREAKQRPCLTINRMPSFVDQVVGDARQNRLAIKVRPKGSGADQGLAEVFQGLIRNIEVQSDADMAYITGLESAVESGLGFFRVITQYADDDTFDQDIRIKRIPNRFSVYLDPDHQEADGSDASYAFVTDVITNDEFKERWPGKDTIEMSDAGEGDEYKDWAEQGKMRIAEYFRRVPVKKTLALLSTGETVDKADFVKIQDELAEAGMDITIVRERECESWKVEWSLISGNAVLEGPRDWPGKYIPICIVRGKERFVNGERREYSLIRNAKDSQRMYNFWRSAAVETVALAPKAPWLATPQQIENHEEQWRTAHTDNHPYLLYNHDPNAPAIPQRQSPPQLPMGAVEEVRAAAEDIKSTIGIYDASLGAKSNETSGRAIIARQREGDNGTFVFHDNLRRAVRYCAKILIDLIPRVYDTEREVRILGEQDQERMVKINTKVFDSQTQEWVKFNDLSIGKYDVVVDAGPSYATKRLEAADSMVDFIRAYPAAAPILGDLLAKNLDWPGADEVARRLQAMLPPAINQQGPPAPDPEKLAKAEKTAAEAEGQKLENAKLAQELATSNARIAAFVEQQVVKILMELTGGMPGQPQGAPMAHVSGPVGMGPAGTVGMGQV